MHILRRFKLDQSLNLVLGGESRQELLFVFVYPTFKIVGHANIERSRPAGHDVDVILFHSPPL